MPTNRERLTKNNEDLLDIKTTVHNLPTMNLQSKEITITQNGTTTIEPDTGYNGLNDVDVIVNVSGGSGSVKQFATVQEMNQSTGNVEGDLAIVYSSNEHNLTENDTFSKAKFPQSVTISPAIDEQTLVDLSFIPTDETSEVNCYGFFTYYTMDFNVSDMSTGIEQNVRYESEDGIHYTRITEDEIIDYGVELQFGSIEGEPQWDDRIGQFFIIGDTSFNGLYVFTNNAFELAPSQLTATLDKVYNGVFYGKNGVQTGTLGNTQNLSVDEVVAKSEFFNKFNNLDLADNITSLLKLFENNTNIVVAPLINTENITNMEKMFNGCTNLTTIQLMNTSNVTTMEGMFSNCNNLTRIPLLDTSNVTTMRWAFNGCWALTEFPQLDTSNVTNMNSMFNYCTNLERVPQLDTSNVTIMGSMFNGCGKLSNDSLNNILVMCINSNVAASYKTLQAIGLTQAQATICQTLSNWNDFVAAGWRNRLLVYKLKKLYYNKIKL